MSNDDVMECRAWGGLVIKPTQLPSRVMSSAAKSTRSKSVDTFCELDPRGRPTNLDGEGSEEEEALMLPPPAPVAIPTDGECWDIPDEEDSTFKN